MSDPTSALAGKPPAAPAPASPPADPLSADRDSLGRPFDPAKFRPEKDTAGRWKNLRAGGPGKRRGPAAQSSPGDLAPADFSDVDKASRAAGTAPAGAAAGAPAGPAPLVVDEYTEAAAGAVAGVSTLVILALGAHAAPTAEQAGAMVRAYADCFRAYSYAPKTPPWLGPAVATAAWVGPHLADKRSQERLQGWRAKWVNLVLWWRSKRDARAATAAATASVRTESPA